LDEAVERSENKKNCRKMLRGEMYIGVGNMGFGIGIT
jgi:hypothetical protein